MRTLKEHIKRTVILPWNIIVSLPFNESTSMHKSLAGLGIQSIRIHRLGAIKILPPMNFFVPLGFGLRHSAIKYRGSMSKNSSMMITWWSILEVVFVIVYILLVIIVTVVVLLSIAVSSFTSSSKNSFRNFWD